MRRSELDLCNPGYYIVDGDVGDPDGFVICGPIPSSTEAEVLAAQYAVRLKRVMTISQVLELAPVA